MDPSRMELLETRCGWVLTGFEEHTFCSIMSKDWATLPP